MVSRMRPRREPGPAMLFAGDSGDLAAIRSRLADCAPDATGLVIIEVLNAMQIVPVDAPRGMGVHWVFRESRSGIAPRGSRLVAAVDAWLDEWMRPEGAVAVSIWLGARASEPVVDFAARLDRELAASR
ncbi:SIP domain-containing protein [Agromyces sp. NPDC058110]|uniref:SIP domain-containing protein n=1 Tax=Agromyces sp. NPDC058110 TaxID=3346345 RepID=UPI0036DEEB3E